MVSLLKPFPILGTNWELYLLGCLQDSGTPGHCSQYILFQIKGRSQETYRLKASVFILRPPPSSGFAAQ